MNRARRAFALPLVILLALVATLAGTLLLELQTNSTSAVNRQTKVYEDHHLAAGMRELIDQWLLTGGTDIAQRLEDDGLAFTLDLPRGQTIRVYLEDAQGTLLRDLSNVSGPAARLLDRAVEQLELAAAPAYGPSGEPLDRPALFRTLGPPQVSVNAASEQVLEAIAAASDNPAGARSLMRHIRAKAGQETPLTQEELTSLFANVANLSDAESRQLSSVLTAQPVLWRMVIETRHGSLSTARVERSAALIQIPPSGQGIVGNGVIILTWEDVVEDPRRPLR